VLSTSQRNQLHQIAKASIEHGLSHGEPLPVDLDTYDTDLQAKRATFVTLHKNLQLRGCIGILEPLRPLAEDIAYNACAAAFSDRRFAPVTADEINQLDIHISILADPETIDFSSEQDLLEQIRPGVDGLIMEEGSLRGTFLPSVWESVTDRRDFLNHLKQKTGLPMDYWSDTISVKRYTVEEF